jgi:phospholipid transport system substrate-binding protein
VNLCIAFPTALTASATCLLLLTATATADLSPEDSPEAAAANTAAHEASGEASDSNATQPIATPSVEKLHTELIAIMRSADQLGYTGRYEQLWPVVDQTFDLHFMASKSVGRHWKQLAEADRERWLSVFERLITANYAGRFSAFSGESFETLGEEDAIHDTRVVRTLLVRPGDEDVQLNYRLRDVDGEWRIIDIYLNGTVSELALRRSEYSSVLKRDGFEKLISTLHEKVESLSQG